MNTKRKPPRKWPINPNNRRPLGVKVEPATLDSLKALAKVNHRSQGSCIDRLVARAQELGPL